MRSLIVGTILAYSITGTANTDISKVFQATKVQGPKCYGKEYSTPYLKQKQKHMVKRIRVKVGYQKPIGYQLHLEVVLKGKKNQHNLFKSLMLCDGGGACYIECDGGSASLSVEKNNAILFQPHGPIALSGCRENSKPILLKFLKELKLYPLHREYCKF